MPMVAGKPKSGFKKLEEKLRSLLKQLQMIFRYTYMPGVARARSSI